MEFFAGTGNNITLLEVGLLIFLNTVANVWMKPKLAILINLLFTFYWVFFLNFDFLFGAFQYSEYSLFYFGFVLIIFIFSVIGLTRES
jgi:hypothetical protein